MYYAYTSILGKSEEEFWQATPRKVYSQLEIHEEVNRPQRNKSKNNGRNETDGETVCLKVLD
jgi:hypothetical protein